jgi:hypothetical protein
MTLYRAGYNEELFDFASSGVFQTGPNTLEGKQFFRTDLAVREFAGEANRIGYEPLIQPFLLFQSMKVILTEFL